MAETGPKFSHSGLISREYRPSQAVRPTLFSYSSHIASATE